MTLSPPDTRPADVPRAERTGTIVESLRERAVETTPGVRLLHADRPDEVLAWRALIERAECFAGLLTDRGVGPGAHVAIVHGHGVDLYATFLGALIAGVVPSLWAPPSPKQSRDRYDRMLANQLGAAKPDAVIFDDACGASVGNAAGAGGVTTVMTTRGVASGVARPEWDDPDPDACAFLQYTSGTTGAKKAVAVTHTALAWQVDAYAHAIDLRPGTDRIVTWLPLYHDMGLITSFLIPVMTGTPIVAMCPFAWVRDPASWLRAVGAHRATLSWMPNFAFAFLAERGRSPGPDVDLSSLRGLINCSEPILDRSMRRFAAAFASRGFDRRALGASYAMAECTFAATSGGVGRPLPRDVIDGLVFARAGRAVPVPDDHPHARVLVSSGSRVSATQIAVVGDDGDALPDRTLGELVVRSPSRAPYVEDVAGDGPLRTGDLGYLVDGEVYVTGRSKDLLIVRGVNVDPHEVEAAVSELDDVIPGRVVVFGCTDTDAGTERIVVLVESHATDADTLARLRRAVVETATASAIVPPSDVRIVPHMWLVKSTSGKIARGANRDRYVETFGGAGAGGHMDAGTDGDTHSDAGAGVDTDTDTDTGTSERAGEGADTDVRALVFEAVRAVIVRHGRAVPDDLDGGTLLVERGLIDSLALADLIVAVETRTGMAIAPSTLIDPDALGTIDRIATLVGAPVADEASFDEAIDVGALGAGATRRSQGFWTWRYRWLFRRRGIRCGRGVRVLGPLLLRLDGDPRNIVIGDDVTLMPGVDLKIRENGRIVLRDGVVLDTNVRLVAANDATIELGARAQIGMGSIVNAGVDVRFGVDAVTAGGCTILASEHRYLGAAPILEQGYRHAPVEIGNGAWIAANATIAPGVRIGAGAVVGARSDVRDDVPARAMVVGSPARVVRFRAVGVTSEDARARRSP